MKRKIPISVCCHNYLVPSVSLCVFQQVDVGKLQVFVVLGHPGIVEPPPAFYASKLFLHTLIHTPINF